MSGWKDLAALDASRLAVLTRTGAVSAEEAARACIDRIGQRDAAVGAWAWLEPDAAIAQARRLDAGSARGPLFGVPVGIKDVFQTKDMPTEHNSPIYAGHRPGIDAACIDTLRAAGALILGKTTTVEFAGGFGRPASTRHPLDPGRSPGGTSSGTAAAVADRQVPLGFGTQTAGSTIRPASFCGVHGMKPTWGTVSREGVKFISVSLDTVTWMARSVDDLALVADVFALEDAEPRRPIPIREMRIAICRTPAWSAASETVRTGLAHSADRLADAGAAVVEFELPDEFAALRDAQIAIMMGEAKAALLNEYRAHPDLLDPSYIDVIEGSWSVRPAKLRDALDLGARCRIAFDTMAARFDAVVTPSATDEAPIFGQGTGNAAFNQIWSILHVPCINLPVLTGPNGLPVGLTLTGPRFADRRLLASARAIEPVLLHGDRGNRP
jgi:Asp-tRNA(Asn)/Glu-tRNA(Gln) amidotransferase A subunit family amidase